MSSSVDLLFAVCVGLGLAPRIMLPYCPNAEIRGFFSLLGDYGGNIGVSTGNYNTKYLKKMKLIN
jgi:hypothetical protein